MKTIYLDNAATTALDKRVLKEILPFLKEKYGNASSIHSKGRAAFEALEKARQRIAKALGCSAEEIFFTSGGTESDNLAIRGALKASGKKHLIASKIEHPAVLRTCEALEKEGFCINYLGVDKFGIIDLEELKNTITEETALVSIMHANNEIGSIQPIEEIGKICREKNVLFHCDAVQSIGKIPINLEFIDLLSVSSHKIFGPKGAGALYVKKGTNISPIVFGGGQEKRLRSGTENTAGIAGFGKAMELISKESKKIVKHDLMLRDRLIKKILNEIPNAQLTGHPKKRLPGIASFVFQGIEGEALVLKLDAKGICASTGSACSSKSLTASHVLTAIGLARHISHGSLRLSIGRFNSVKEIDFTVKCLKQAVKELRAISPIAEKD